MGLTAGGSHEWWGAAPAAHGPTPPLLQGKGLQHAWPRVHKGQPLGSSLTHSQRVAEQQKHWHSSARNRMQPLPLQPRRFLDCQCCLLVLLCC